MTSFIFTVDGIQFGDQAISWDQIDQERNKIRFNDHLLIGIYWPIKRGQDVTDEFIISKADWDFWKPRLIGQYFFFDELNGKFGHVHGTIQESDVTINDKLEDIISFHYSFGLSHGRVCFMDSYAQKVLDREIEDPEFLKIQYPNIYQRIYEKPNDHPNP